MRIGKILFPALIAFVNPVGLMTAQNTPDANDVLTGEWRTDTISTFLGSIAYNYTFLSDGTGEDRTFHVVLGESESSVKNFKWEIVKNDKIRIISNDGVLKELNFNIIDSENIIIDNEKFRLISKPKVISKTPVINTNNISKKKVVMKSRMKSSRRIN